MAFPSIKKWMAMEKKTRVHHLTRLFFDRTLRNDITTQDFFRVYNFFKMKEENELTQVYDYLFSMTPTKDKSLSDIFYDVQNKNIKELPMESYPEFYEYNPD